MELWIIYVNVFSQMYQSKFIIYIIKINQLPLHNDKSRRW